MYNYDAFFFEYIKVMFYVKVYQARLIGFWSWHLWKSNISRGVVKKQDILYPIRWYVSLRRKFWKILIDNKLNKIEKKTLLCKDTWKHREKTDYSEWNIHVEVDFQWDSFYTAAL